MALSVERAAKNQVLFREVNERIADLSAPALVDDVRLFVCECSHEDCIDALEISATEYEAVRQEGARFLIVPGHEIDAIERVVTSNSRFAVVEKLAEARAVAVEHDPRR
jgi:hypothetical protein